MKVYGPNDYDPYYTHVIGFNSGGWVIFAQRSDANGTVHSVEKLHP
jgi:hypothetical protein